MIFLNDSQGEKLNCEKYNSVEKTCSRLLREIRLPDVRGGKPLTQTGCVERGPQHGPPFEQANLCFVQQNNNVKKIYLAKEFSVHT